MKHYDATADGRRVDAQEANALNDLTEDVPVEAPPTESLPPMKGMTPDEDLEEAKRKGVQGRGMERALEMLEEYEEGISPRDPDVPQYEE